MKRLIIFLLLFISVNSFATIRYISSSTGSDANNGLTTGTAYATLSKIASVFGGWTAGDTLLFKRGDTFYGSISFNNNGTASKPMYFDAYSTGANPVISGLTTLSSWTNSSGNIYYTSLTVPSTPSLNLVLYDGNVQPMGRYPNAGYLTYQNSNYNASITDSSLTGTPNWTGGEAVIKKYRWIIDRHGITSQSGSTLNINAIGKYGNNAAYYPINGNGYFIQNHLSTLDQNGEWYYDTTAKRLYMYFGTAPSNHTVKAATIQDQITLYYLNYLSFNNLDFEGGNLDAINCTNVVGITFNSCNFRNQGGNGFYADGVNGLTFTNCTVNNVLNNGLYVLQNGVNTTINNCNFTNVGMVAGAGQSGDAAQEAMNIQGSGVTVTNSVVKKAGYNGIHFSGNNALINKNYVDSFCMVKDDGAGIYIYENDSILHSNRVVSNNLVLNAVGCFDGNGSVSSYENFGKAAAIYLDGTSNNVELRSNTLANGYWAGIYLNNNSHNKILTNTIYNFDAGVFLYQNLTGSMRDITITSNRIIAKLITQNVLRCQFYTTDTPQFLGVFSGNTYARPIDDNASIQIIRIYSAATGGGTFNYTLGAWKAAFSQDAGSVRSAISITDPNTLKFDYNNTVSPISISLTGNYKDVSNNNYSGSYNLAAYGGNVLAPYIPNTGKKVLIFNNKIVINPAGKILTTN